VNNCIIPSMHAERKIALHSYIHSFTPYSSLSPYRQTNGITDGGMNTLAVRGLEELFFQLCHCVSFFVVAGNSFRCYLTTIPVVPLCLVAQISFLVVAGKSLRCYLLIDHTSCAVVSVFGCGRK
jgi:hypothetical protein